MYRNKKILDKNKPLKAGDALVGSPIYPSLIEADSRSSQASPKRALTFDDVSETKTALKVSVSEEDDEKGHDFVEPEEPSSDCSLVPLPIARIESEPNGEDGSAIYSKDPCEKKLIGEKEIGDAQTQVSLTQSSCCSSLVGRPLEVEDSTSQLLSTGRRLVGGGVGSESGNTKAIRKMNGNRSITSSQK